MYIISLADLYSVFYKHDATLTELWDADISM